MRWSTNRCCSLTESSPRGSVQKAVFPAGDRVQNVQIAQIIAQNARSRPYRQPKTVPRYASKNAYEVTR